MKGLKKFLSFVEIRTKLASILPFLTGISYVYFVNHTINVKSTIVFFIGMLLFDMATTAINNYIDMREAGAQGYFIRPVMLGMIFSMCLAAAALGLYLTYLHGLVVLFMGIICFAAGICYTFGPAPISRSPYGEVVSGLVEGFCLPFLAVFINSQPADFIQYDYLNPFLHLQINPIGIIKLFLVTTPLICCIANIMLANNICDLEADANSRYTLPRHIGRKNALLVFSALYYAAYLAIAAACVLRVIPILSLLTLLTFVTIRKNISQFHRRQSKAETFGFSIQNFVLIIVPYIFCIGIGAIL